MHPNPAFRQVETARNLAFAREAGFGVLTLAGDDGPLISHIPFTLDEAGAVLTAHIVRSNPIWRRLREGEAEAAMIVSGPHGYISPDWYGADDQVPTWNYVAVHLRGVLRLLDQERLRGALDALSARFEADLAPKPPWTSAKMDRDALAKMERMIVPIEMTVRDVQGTWKLSQNKPAEVRAAAVEGLGAPGAGMEIERLRALMREV